jgi:hypothetical protein
MVHLSPQNDDVRFTDQCRFLPYDSNWAASGAYQMLIEGQNNVFDSFYWHIANITGQTGRAVLAGLGNFPVVVRNGFFETTAGTTVNLTHWFQFLNSTGTLLLEDIVARINGTAASLRALVYLGVASTTTRRHVTTNRIWKPTNPTFDGTATNSYPAIEIDYTAGGTFTPDKATWAYQAIDSFLAPGIFSAASPLDTVACANPTGWHRGQEKVGKIHSAYGANNPGPWRTVGGTNESVAFAAGWAASAGTAVQFRERNGMIDLAGSATKTGGTPAAGDTILTLEAGNRPATTKQFVVVTGALGAAGRISVDSGGAVKWQGGNSAETDYTVLDGVSFRAEL